MKKQLFDKTGREIMAGDTLKIYHFTGRRRKRHYMYGWVISIKGYGKRRTRMLRISHLNLEKSSYLKLADGRKTEGIEIVQGFGSNGINFSDRPVIIQP